MIWRRARFGTAVRARYLAIADHYVALADAELRSDKLERKSRLAEMQAMRAAAARAERDVGRRPRATNRSNSDLYKATAQAAGKRRIRCRRDRSSAMTRLATKRDR